MCDDIEPSIIRRQHPRRRPAKVDPSCRNIGRHIDLGLAGQRHWEGVRAVAVAVARAVRDWTEIASDRGQDVRGVDVTDDAEYGAVWRHPRVVERDYGIAVELANVLGGLRIAFR